MTPQDSDRDPVELLAEEFAERYRRGERPTLTEYVEKHPELAEQIRELFPALAFLEQFGSVGGPPSGVPSPGPVFGTALARLGEYRILREVGRGGMGVVYEAVQESLGRHVALKVLPFYGATNAVYRERFKREAQAAARLHHTNIVPVYGVGEHEGVHYYAMQFIQGQGLDAVLREVKRIKGEKDSPTVIAGMDDPNATRSVALKLLNRTVSAAGVVPVGAVPTAAADQSPSAGSGSQAELAGKTEAQYFRETARMAFQVAEALAYAHQHGIIHRDVKPSNLLLDGEGVVWVTDFGLAKAEGSDELTNSGDILGTFRYMAPERFHGVSDLRGDVYGLGVTLYEMLTLRPAFDDADRARLIHQVTNDSPPRPRLIDARIPRDLETIVLKAMAREPGDRYATAGAMAEDLLRYLEDRPVRARRASLLERAWRWRRRNPVLSAVGGLAVAALLATAGLSLGLAYQQWRLADAASKSAGILAVEHQDTLAALNKYERLSANLAVDRSLSTCEDGDVGPGMLWLADALGLAEKADDADLAWGVRTNLAAWRRELSPLRAVLPHSGRVTAAAFRPDGKVLLTASVYGKAQRWDAATGEPVGAALSHGGAIRAVAWSRDGKVFATAGGDDKEGGWAWLWDAASGRRLSDEPLRQTGEIRAVAFRADGRAVLTAGVDESAQLWDVETGRPLWKQPLRHKGQIQCATFSSDGGLILTASMDKTARLWDASDGKLLHELVGHTGEVWSAAFSPDGKTIVTGGMDQTARLWDAESGKQRGEPLLLQTAIVAVAFRPGGKVFLTAGGTGQVAFWRTDTRRPAGRPLGHPGGVLAAAFDPDGKTVLTGCVDGVARLWELAPDPVARISLDRDAQVNSAAFSPDAGEIVVGGRDSARVWATSTGRPLFDGPLPHAGDLETAAFSPDGRLVLTGGSDGEVRLWRAADGRPVGTPLHHEGGVWSAAFRPDGRRLATSDASGAISFWETETGKRLSNSLPFQGRVATLAYSPDGKTLLVGAQDGQGRLWAADGDSRCGPLPTPQGCWSAVFAPDGATCVTGSTDGAAQVWDAASCKSLGPPMRRRSAVRAVAFSPDGRTLLTGGADGAARLWQPATGKPIGPGLQGTGSVLAVAFTPDGRTLRMSDGREVLGAAVPAPVEGEAERIVLWAQVMTGMELGADNAVRPLDATTWRERRQRLDELGGPPLP